MERSEIAYYVYALNFGIERLEEKGKKALRKMPKLQTLRSSSEYFLENVKRAHFQKCVWKSSLDPDLHQSLMSSCLGVGKTYYQK